MLVVEFLQLAFAEPGGEPQEPVDAVQLLVANALLAIRHTTNNTPTHFLILISS
jgi:hypothetical protein